MVPVRYLTALALIGSIISGCDSVQIRSDYDPEADFGAYQTYAWISEQPLLSAPAEASPLASGRIQRAVAKALAAKGFGSVSDVGSADFLVGFTLGARDKVRVDTNRYPVGFRGPYRWGLAYYQDVDVRQYTQGRLAIDVFDAKLQRPVWHGYATKNLSSGDRKNAEKLIGEAVAAILAEFPPR